MGKVRIEINEAEVGRILRGEGEYGGVRAELERRAQAIAAAAGEGMEASVEIGANRVHASVITATPDAMIAEAADRALSRALEAGRG